MSRGTTDVRKIKRQVSVHVNIRLPLSRTTRRFHIGVAVVTELQPRTSTTSKNLTNEKKNEIECTGQTGRSGDQTCWASRVIFIAPETIVSVR